MANCKEHYLPELELATGQVREALQAILHTILFIRSPGSITPCDVHCEGFDVTYTKIASSTQEAAHQTGVDASSDSAGSSAMDRKVDSAIETFLRSLVQIGPELMSGNITLSFFERRASRQLFGFVSHEERVVWEQWILQVVVSNTPRPINNDPASIIERQRLQDTAETMIKSTFLKIFELANGSNIDHIPPVMYEFDISCQGKNEDKREQVYSRVSNLPSLISLS